MHKQILVLMRRVGNVIFGELISLGLGPDNLLVTSAEPASRNRVKRISPARLNRKEFTALVSLLFFGLAIDVRKMSGNPILHLAFGKIESCLVIKGKAANTIILQYDHI